MYVCLDLLTDFLKHKKVVEELILCNETDGLSTKTTETGFHNAFCSAANVLALFFFATNSTPILPPKKVTPEAAS
jgi:hypothetical protein